MTINSKQSDLAAGDVTADRQSAGD